MPSSDEVPETKPKDDTNEQTVALVGTSSDSAGNNVDVSFLG